MSIALSFIQYYVQRNNHTISLSEHPGGTSLIYVEIELCWNLLTFDIYYN